MMESYVREIAAAKLQVAFYKLLEEYLGGQALLDYEGDIREIGDIVAFTRPGAEMKAAINTAHTITSPYIKDYIKSVAAKDETSPMKSIAAKLFIDELKSQRLIDKSVTYFAAAFFVVDNDTIKVLFTGNVNRHRSVNGDSVCLKCEYCGVEMRIDGKGSNLDSWAGHPSLVNWCRFQYAKDYTEPTPWCCSLEHMIKWLSAEYGGEPC